MTYETSIDIIHKFRVNPTYTLSKSTFEVSGKLRLFVGKTGHHVAPEDPEVKITTKSQ